MKKLLIFIFALMPVLLKSASAASEEEIAHYSPAWEKAKELLQNQLPENIISAVQKMDTAYKKAIENGKGPEKINLELTKIKLDKLVFDLQNQNSITATRGEHAILLASIEVINETLDTINSVLKLKDAASEEIEEESLAGGEEIAEEFES